MTRRDLAHARRNTLVLVTTAVVLGLLMLLPASSNRAGSHRRPGTPLAPAGIVSPAAPGATTTTTTVNGASVDTRYGPVQVQLVLRARHILRATAIDYPQNSGRDREINRYAIPVLQRETLSAQSAQVDTVSGATYTSEGYRRSLQAALDAAHIG